MFYVPLGYCIIRRGCTVMGSEQRHYFLVIVLTPQSWGKLIIFTCSYESDWLPVCCLRKKLGLCARLFSRSFICTLACMFVFTMLEKPGNDVCKGGCKVWSSILEVFCPTAPCTPIKLLSFKTDLILLHSLLHCIDISVCLTISRRWLKWAYSVYHSCFLSILQTSL